MLTSYIPAAQLEHADKAADAASSVAVAQRLAINQADSISRRTALGWARARGVAFAAVAEAIAAAGGRINAPLPP